MPVSFIRLPASPRHCTKEWRTTLRAFNPFSDRDLPPAYPVSPPPARVGGRPLPPFLPLFLPASSPPPPRSPPPPPEWERVPTATRNLLSTSPDEQAYGIRKR